MARGLVPGGGITLAGVLETLLDVLRCPVCAGSLRLAGPSLQCDHRHTFDVARQGYVNLLGGVVPTTAGDSAEMVRARAEFQATGHFAPLARAVAVAAAEVIGDGEPTNGVAAGELVGDGEPTNGVAAGELVGDGEPAVGVAGAGDGLLGGAVGTATDGVVLDAGAGTGYYLAAVLDELPTARGLALDVSKFAARQAARAHERIGAAVWDSWQPWPVTDAAVDIVLNVFAPRNGAEFRRILRPGGTALVVTPQPTHLAELGRITGMLQVDPDKDGRLERSLAPHLDFEAQQELVFPLALFKVDVRRLVRMGPSARHVDPDTLEAYLAEVDEPVRATAAVVVSRFRHLLR
jgi:23S rRNA (guanine745-N1)-methyltransferase